MYINYIILPLLLPLLSYILYKADAQGFVDFPAGTEIDTDTIVSTNGKEIEVNLQMTGATPKRANQTICTGFNIPKNDLFYIFEFASNVDPTKVHHMALYACSKTPAVNPCKCSMQNRSPLFSWAKFTPPVRFTGSEATSFGVFRVGQGTDRTFVFLETHYHHAFSDPDTSGITIRMTRNLNTEHEYGYYELAIFPLMATGTIPANTARYNIDMCINTGALPDATWSDFRFVVGFQSHTHNLGRVVSSIIDVNDIPSSDTFSELGVGNPLWPNAYIASQPTPILNHEYSIFTRCVYTSTGVPNDTNTNGRFQTQTAWHEMCVQGVIFAQHSEEGPWKSTTPAFLTGKCTAEQSSAMDDILPSTFPGTTEEDEEILNTYAKSGIGTDSYDYETANNQNYNINLDMQTFEYFFDDDSKKRNL